LKHTELSLKNDGYSFFTRSEKSEPMKFQSEIHPLVALIRGHTTDFKTFDDVD
jgi:hypothetical protein